MRTAAVLAVGASIALLAACVGEAPAVSGGGCSNDYSGRWKLSGSCSNTSCNVTQNGCGLGIRCDDGAKGTGSLQGSGASIAGLLGTGDTGSCDVVFKGSSLSLQCTSSRTMQPCTGSGTCESGACGAPVPTSSSGSSGTDAGTVACKQKPDSDRDPDCANQPDRPRKLDCDAEDVAAAVAAGCSQIPASKPGEASTDVCCRLGVSGVPGGSSSSSSSTSGGVDSGTTCAGTFGGTYSMSGTCAETSCSVVQTGCSLRVTCAGGATMTGTATSTRATLSGTWMGSSVSCTSTATSTTTFDLDCGICTSKGTRTGG